MWSQVTESGKLNDLVKSAWGANSASNFSADSEYFL